MKRVDVFVLFTSLIALLAVSERGFAADTDAGDKTTVVVAGKDVGENREDDSFEDDDEEDEEEQTRGVTTGYSASISDAKWKNGRCHKEVSVKGPGIDDTIPVDCSLDNFQLSNSTMLVVGGALYSDTPNTLVVVKGGRCEKRTYSQPQSSSSSGSPPAPVITRMSPQECVTVRRNMVKVRGDTTSQLSTLGSALPGVVFGNNVAHVPNVPLVNGNTGNGFMDNFRFGL